MNALLIGLLLYLLRPVGLALAQWRIANFDRSQRRAFAVRVDKYYRQLVADLLMQRRRGLTPAGVYGMPWGTAVEPKILDGFFGNLIGCVRTAVAAAATAQTAINTGSVATGGVSGNMDVTPGNNTYVIIATPGAGATQNQYTKASLFLVASSTATVMTIASQSFGPGISVGDFIFQIGTTTTLGALMMLNTLYVGLSTVGATTTVAAGSDLGVLPTTPITVVSTGVANGGAALTNGGSFTATGTLLIDSSLGLQTVAYTGVTATTFTGCTGGVGTIDTTSTVVQAPTQAQILAGEPTATGSYARVAMPNTPANFSAATGSIPAQKVNAASVSFPASTAAWSTGANGLNLWFIADAPTLAGGSVIAYGYMTVAQVVNASGITPSFAASQLVGTQL